LGVTLRDEAEGVVVAGVMPNSPAAEAGIRAGDQLLGIGDQLVSTSSDVIDQVASRRPGEKVVIRVDRAGLKGALRAVLASRSEVNRRAALGVTLSRGTHGSVRVLAVAPNSPAAKAGLRMGDRIVAIDDHKVTSYRDVIDWIGADHPGDQVRLKIDRYGLEGQLLATLTGEDQILQAPAPAAPPAVASGPSPEDLLFENTPAQIDDQRGYGD
jgi:S1-C subfamily serine protease